MSIAEWQSLATSLHARADRLTHAIVSDARRTCHAAGLDPTLLGIHPHNAMVSLHYGKPWPEVNYALCRKTLWLIERSYEPSRIVDRILGRAFARLELGR